MDFTTIVTRLNELTTFMNNVVSLSKKIFQLPPSTSGVKLVAVYNESSQETEQFNLSDALDGMYSLTNGITALGDIVRDGADFTFEVGFEWEINGIEYANAEITITINDAGTGNHRIDIAVVDENDDIYIIEGFEVPLTTAVVQPPTPPNTLFLCSFLITESVIGDPSTPIITEQNNIPLKVDILSTDLTTDDIAGFVDYFNDLNPTLEILETTSLVQYLCTDTQNIYQLTGVGKGVYGLSNTQITSDNVLKISLSQNLQNLQSVTDEGNETTTPIKVKDSEKSFTLQSNGINFEDLDDGGNTLLRFENTSEISQEVIIRGLGGTMALLSDISTPTLEEVLTEGYTATDKSIELSSSSSDDVIILDSASQTMGVVNLSTGAIAAIKSTFVEVGLLTGESFRILKDKIRRTIGGFYSDLVFTNPTANRTITFKDESGTVAYLTDIPTSSGIPHGTASGTDTYAVTISGVTSYSDGDAYLIRFTNGNTSTATLNINSLGAITLYRNNDGALIGGDIVSGGDMLCVYDSAISGFRVIGTAPNTLLAYVTNDDSVTLTKGMPVYAFSGTGDRMTVKRAYNTSDATSAQTVGLVLSSSISAGQKGLIIIQGLLDGLSILPTSTFADGDAIYLGATAGTITNVKPSAPNHLVYLGVVTTASNGSSGRMYVRIQNGYELQELHNVALTNPPNNNDLLTYETASSLWKNKSIDDILGYTPYRFVDATQATYLGSVIGLSETAVAQTIILGGTFNSSDLMKILFRVTKVATSAGVNMRIKVNTTNNLATATQIGILTLGAVSTYGLINRHINLFGGNAYNYNSASTLASDILLTNTAGTSFAYNTANDLYVFFTIQLGNIADSATFQFANITN